MTMTMTTTTHNSSNSSSNNKNDDDDDEETTRLLNSNHTNHNTTNVSAAIHPKNHEMLAPITTTTMRHRRYVNLFLIVWTTPGIKFFKSAQSSFQEYLMQNPQIHLSATTYGLILSLISMPVVPLIGGILLDYKGGNGRGRGGGEHRGRTHMLGENAGTMLDEDEDELYRAVTPATTHDAQSHGREGSRRQDLVTSLRTLAYGTTTVTGTGRSDDGAAPPPVAQTHALCVFSVVTFGGIVVYGLGMEVAHTIPLGLLGAVIFGLGEGCIMVAARAFIGHEFRSADGATAQGVLIAMNNFAMMASKNSLPWLIETAHHHHRITTITTTTTATTTENDENDDDNYSIAIGIVACISVQLVSTGASIWYSLRCRRFQKQQQQQQQQDRVFQEGRNRPQVDKKEKTEKETTKQQHQYPNNTNYPQPTTGFERGREGGEDNDAVTRNIVSSDDGRMRSGCGGIAATGCAQSGVTSITTLFHLPITFWIVAIARAIFLVTFKVFSRYSNSFLIEKYGASAVMAGRKSSLNELFALFSPLVGFLAYRSPGGIVTFVIGGGILAAISIGSLTFVPPELITLYLPGGNVTPLIGISIAHGIIVPIMIAIIPHTVPPVQLGMAFAVVEVLGNTLNLTDIVFGWLRDISGDYDAPMKLLFVYALIGISLLLASRNRIGKIGIGRLSIR